MLTRTYNCTGRWCNSNSAFVAYRVNKESSWSNHEVAMSVLFFEGKEHAFVGYMVELLVFAVEMMAYTMSLQVLLTLVSYITAENRRRQRTR